jgi:hypothetical protein
MRMNIMQTQGNKREHSYPFPFVRLDLVTYFKTPPLPTPDRYRSILRVQRAAAINFKLDHYQKVGGKTWFFDGEFVVESCDLW